MTKLLQLDFSYPGPFGEEMAEALTDDAHTISAEPGLIWKIWTENASAQLGGGIYLFETEETAKAYLEKNAARYKELGIPELNAKIFDINIPLSKITRGPID